MLRDLFWLASGGAAGTLARYTVSTLAHHALGRHFPWGTFSVNVLGCFLYGLVWSLAEERYLLNEQARMFALTGFMGAFTTFSTFAFETGGLARDGQWQVAVLNLLLQNMLGLAALWLGLSLPGYWR